MGATENARPENAGLENDGQLRKESHGLDNAGLENDGQNFSQLWANYGVWKMQDWKMTDKILANSGQNYRVWKMQDWKMTDHVFY